jgi:DNA-binding MarR family transcriptional regulator
MDNTTTQQQPKENNFDIVVIKFADSKVPQFKEVKNKEWILYGDDNFYPEYLLYLYNKSSTHGSIINAKTKYVCGSGLKKSQNINGGFNDWTENINGVEIKHSACSVNRNGETLFDIIEKSQKDIEIFGGFRWVVAKNRLGQVAEIYHVDFYKFRKDKDTSGFWYKEDWLNHKEQAVYYNSFDPNDHSDTNFQIFAFDEYRPGCKWYPMPGYIGCNNYIEVDVEISKFHLSSIKNGMTPSKMIQFYTGEPEETKKKAIEKRFRDKFSGSENAGKFILVFNGSKEKTVDVNDLSGSDNDKMFDILNKTVEQHIITGHEVVSPMLFGIKTEGQLGGNNEIRTAYEVFINTYAKPKQTKLERIINYFGSLMGKGNDYCITQLDPVRIVVSDEMIKDVLQPDEVRELAGLPVVKREETSQGAKILSQLAAVSPLVANKILESLSEDEIRSFVGLQPKVATGTPVDVNGVPIPQQQQANANLGNVTMQQVNRILSIAAKYQTGKLTYAQALMLIQGIGLTEEQAASWLVTPEEEPPTTQTTDLPAQQNAQFSATELTMDQVVLMFDSCGDLKDDYHIITSKRKHKFDSITSAEYEADFFKGCFAATEVTNAESKILELIKKDSKVTPEVIAKALKTTPEYVTSKIASLTERGILESSETAIGDDIEVERKVVEKTKPPKGDSQTQISIKYSYEVKPGIGPAIIKTTRPFCEKLIKLDRLYSRGEIEKISERLGYSVWDRRGGWWGDSPTCRHIWVSHVVVKKGKK